MVFGEITKISDEDIALSIRNKLNSVIDKKNSIISLREWGNDTGYGGPLYSFISQADASGENDYNLVIDETINLTDGANYNIYPGATIICTRNAYFQGSDGGETINFDYGSNLLVAPDQDLFSDDIDVIQGYRSVASVHKGTEWDFSVDGGTIGTINIKKIIGNAYITRAYYEVIDTIDADGPAEISFGIETDDPTGLLGDTYYNSGEFSVGMHNFIPDGNAANFTSKADFYQRNIIMTISGANLISGKIQLWWEESYSDNS